MAQNIADVRDTIGINSKPIAIFTVEAINIIGSKIKRLESENNDVTKVRDVSSTDLSENMVIKVSRGNNPNKREEIEISD